MLGLGDFLEFDGGLFRSAEQVVLVLLAGGQAALGAELQRFGTQAGRAVGDGQADQ